MTSSGHSLAGALPGVSRRHRFWCIAMRREVEVRLEESGVPGLRLATAVRSCTAFDPPTAITCRRRCLDVAFRRQWQSLLRAPADLSPVETSASR